MPMAKRQNEVQIQMQRVQDAVVSGEVTAAELARRSGIPKTTLVGIQEKTWNPRATTLAKLIDGLHKIRALRDLTQQIAAKSP